MEEIDPLGIKAGEPGAKLDAGKISGHLLLDFSKALEAIGEVATFGAKKYSEGGWQYVQDGENRYTSAMIRHLLKERWEENDTDSNLSHKAHLAWNALARLELSIRKEIAHD